MATCKILLLGHQKAQIMKMRGLTSLIPSKTESPDASMGISQNRGTPFYTPNRMESPKRDPMESPKRNPKKGTPNTALNPTPLNAKPKP